MHPKVEIITPEIQKSTETALTIIEAATSMEIATIDDYMNAQGLMKIVKNRIKELTDTRMAQTRPLDESKTKIILFFAAPLEKLEKAKNYLNKIMVNFTEEQEAKRREEERILQEAARKRSEEEQLRQALEAEAAGEKEEAEAIIAEPIYVPQIKVVSEIPKSKESHIREVWNAELIDLVILIKAIANEKAPIEAVEPNMTFLNAQARAYKQALNIPGIKACNKKIQI